MKVCKGVKKKNTDHTPIVYEEAKFVDGEYRGGEPECPLCLAWSIAREQEAIVNEMHETALTREDYIAKIESENTKLLETRGSGFLPLFEVSTVTVNSTTVPTKKKTTKRTKKSAKKKTDEYYDNLP